MPENNLNETNKYLFINLVTMLSITAMQQLGKLVNPAIGGAKVNLEAAQATIDTLDMLSAKTEGRLDNDETRLLKDTLAALKMNYVETRDEEERKAKSEVRGQKPASTEAPTKAEDEQEIKKTDRQEDSKAQGTRGGKAETKDPKFHKSYD